MAIEIKLKDKYLSASHGRYKSKHNMGSSKDRVKRKKIGRAAHEARFGVQPIKIMVLKPRGGTVMVNADEVSI